MGKKKVEITKDMMIAEVLNYRKEAPEVFVGFGMFCFGCGNAQGETLEEASAVHGIDLEFLLKKLNECR